MPGKSTLSQPLGQFFTDDYLGVAHATFAAAGGAALLPLVVQRELINISLAGPGQ
jgi:hypothetical protein